MPSSSSLFVLDGFFCFSLHTGSVILGWLGFVSAFLSIITCSLSFNDIDGFIKDLNITNGKNPDYWTPDDVDFMRNFAISAISMLIGFYVVECVASLFLLHGASNNKRLFLVPWMVERASRLVFYTVLWISIGIYFFTSPQTIGYSIVTLIFGAFPLSESYIKIVVNLLKFSVNFFSLQLVLLLGRLFVVCTNERCRRISKISWSRWFAASTELCQYWNYLCKNLKKSKANNLMVFNAINYIFIINTHVKLHF